MITLKTLAQATEQEVFDQIATHLLNQNARSIDTESRCLYRNADGLKCAAGCLISDDEYDVWFEHQGWGALVAEGLVPEEHRKLIRDLQTIHDNVPPHEWLDELTKLAKKRKLSTKVL